MCVYWKNKNLPQNVIFSARDEELRPATPKTHAWREEDGFRGLSQESFYIPETLMPVVASTGKETKGTEHNICLVLTIEVEFLSCQFHRLLSQLIN